MGVWITYVPLVAEVGCTSTIFQVSLLAPLVPGNFYMENLNGTST